MIGQELTKLRLSHWETLGTHRCPYKQRRPRMFVGISIITSPSRSIFSPSETARGKRKENNIYILLITLFVAYLYNVEVKRLGHLLGQVI